MEGSVWSKLQHVVLSSSVQGHGASRSGSTHSVSGRATSFRDAYSDQAVHTLQEAGPKAGAQKQCRELSVSVDPPDHCRRDLESTAIHPDGDSVLLRRRTQVAACTVAPMEGMYAGGVVRGSPWGAGEGLAGADPAGI